MGKTVEVTFGGEMRRCRLGIGALRELQDRCNAGPATIFARLVTFQPQAAAVKRPRPEDFAHGALDPDYITQANLFAIVRGIGGDWRIDDIRETLRLGLIGGGMTPTDAHLLVMTYIDERPGGLVENISPAAEILNHAIAGEQDDPVGKEAAGKATTEAMSA